MNRIVVIMLVLTLFGCAAAGVTYTRDPHQKIKNAYAMLNNNRVIPAERFAKEALDVFIKKGDKYWQGEAHVALGLIYISNALEAYPKSIEHFKKAIKSFESIQDYTNMSKSKFGLANAYLSSNKLDQHCGMYDQSIKDYIKGKKINPDKEFRFTPRHSSFEGMVLAYKSKYCKA